MNERDCSVWVGAFHQAVPRYNATYAWYGKAGQYEMGLRYRLLVLLLYTFMESLIYNYNFFIITWHDLHDSKLF